MRRYELTVKPQASLRLPRHGREAGSVEINASAVKGALRNAAQRIVNRIGNGQELLDELFGVQDREGLLRFSSLRPRNASGEAEELAATDRRHSSLLRSTRQATPDRHFHSQVTPAGAELEFVGTLETAAPLDPNQEDLLQTATLLADQLGGGRGQGLGLVEMVLSRPDDVYGEPLDLLELLDEDEDTNTWRLAFETIEPILLSDATGPSDCGTGDRLPASSLRGAVAAVLNRLGATKAELAEVFGGPLPAIFGDAILGGPQAVPAPRTLWEGKAPGSHRIDLALRLCASRLWPGWVRQEALPMEGGLGLAEGIYQPEIEGWRKVAIHRRWIQQIRCSSVGPQLPPGKPVRVAVLEPPLRFHVPIVATRSQLRQIVRAAREDLLIGGWRKRGFGRMRLIGLLVGSGRETVAERHRRWVAALQQLTHGQALAEAESSGVFLTFGPLALSSQRLLRGLQALDLELLHGATSRQSFGGWNGSMNLPRGLYSCYSPGSTFVVKTRDGSCALPAMIELESRGLGPGRADGWGHLVCCHPIHLDDPLGPVPEDSPAKER